MILYLEAKTKIKDYIIDSITILTKDGNEVLLTWDEADISRGKEGFSARYKGVYMDEEYANGRLPELEDMTLLEWESYSDEENITDDDVKIERIKFWDGETQTLEFVF